MPTYSVSITTTAQQDKGIARALALVNAKRAQQNPPASALTDAQFVRLICNDRIDDFLREYRDDFRQRVSAAVDAASPSQTAQVAQILGVTE